jgi:hypothetical protein
MRKFLANVLFLFAGLPLALSALFLISARPWALDRATYKRFVEDDRLYAALRAPEMASRAPSAIELRPRGDGATLSLDGPSLVAAAQKDLPWPEIKSTASRSVDSILDAVQGSGAAGAPQLDLRGLKAALKSRAPALARDYEAALAASGRPSQSGLSRGQLSAALAIATDEIPDRAILDERSFPSPRAGLHPLGRGDRMPIGVISRGPDGLSQALLNRMTATTAAMSALLLAGLGVLGGRSLVSRLSRAGSYLLIPSIVVLGVGAALAIPSGLILQNVLPQEAREMVAGEGGALLRSYLASALGPIARSLLITGLVGASVGGVLASSRKFGLQNEIDGPDSRNERLTGRKDIE